MFLGSCQTIKSDVWSSCCQGIPFSLPGGAMSSLEIFHLERWIWNQLLPLGKLVFGQAVPQPSWPKDWEFANIRWALEM